MKYRKTLIAAAAAAMIPVAGTALANEGYDKTGKAGASFDALDTNRDGRISKAEAAADSKIVFSSADANGDGYLDNAEFKKARKAGMDDSTTPSQPQSTPEPTTDPSAPQQDQSAPPPADTETPRQ